MHSCLRHLDNTAVLTTASHRLKGFQWHNHSESPAVSYYENLRAIYSLLVWKLKQA